MIGKFSSFFRAQNNTSSFEFDVRILDSGVCIRNPEEVTFRSADSKVKLLTRLDMPGDRKVSSAGSNVDCPDVLHRPSPLTTQFNLGRKIQLESLVYTALLHHFD